MLDMGFQPQVDAIVQVLPKARQTMLFSATLEGPVAKIAASYTLDAETVLARLERTGRALIVQDEPPNGGYGPAIQSLLCARASRALRGPPRLVARADTFLPYRREEDHLPGVDQVAASIHAMLDEQEG